MLTKPGIIAGNLITAVAGFILASHASIDGNLLFMTLLGLSSIIASACVFNNYIDRHSDEKMTRTQNRALVKKLISGRNAIGFGIALVFLGLWILTVYTNLLTVLIAMSGFLVYVILYSFGKYITTAGTLIGSIAGAVPPLVGYAAASGRVDLGGFVLFMIVVFWQMPHFYAIAMYRQRDYAAASIPVLPVKKGTHLTKIHIFFYVIAFMIATFMLTVLGYAGTTYLTGAIVLSLAWLYLAIKGFETDNDQLWARWMFRFSLVVIVALSILIAVDATHP